MRKVLVYDLPTRLFHWALVACVAGLAVTAYSENGLDWHARLGYAVAALLLFRLVWGFIGGRWSRFASFHSLNGSSSLSLRMLIARVSKS